MGNLGGVRQRPSVEEGIARDFEDKGVRVIDYQPGNGTRYVLTFSEVPKDACGLLGMGTSGSGVVVSDIHRQTSYPFSYGAGTMIHYRYVQEKLKYSAQVDAVVVAELLGVIMGRPFITCEEYTAEQSDQ